MQRRAFGILTPHRHIYVCCMVWYSAINIHLAILSSSYSIPVIKFYVMTLPSYKHWTEIQWISTLTWTVDKIRHRYGKVNRSEVDHLYCISVDSFHSVNSVSTLSSCKSCMDISNWVGFSCRFTILVLLLLGSAFFFVLAESCPWSFFQLKQHSNIHFSGAACAHTDLLAL